MAKDKAKNTPGRQKGGTKSSRWSERTKQNKARAKASRENRLAKAAERREHGSTVIDPITGKAKKSVAKRDQRQLQSSRISAKRSQRRTFAALSPGEKAAHREAGKLHVTPGSLHIKP